MTILISAVAKDCKVFLNVLATAMFKIGGKDIMQINQLDKEESYAKKITMYNYSLRDVLHLYQH